MLARASPKNTPNGIRLAAWRSNTIRTMRSDTRPTRFRKSGLAANTLNCRPIRLSVSKRLNKFKKNFKENFVPIFCSFLFLKTKRRLICTANPRNSFSISNRAAHLNRTALFCQPLVPLKRNWVICKHNCRTKSRERH